MWSAWCNVCPRPRMHSTYWIDLYTTWKLIHSIWGELEAIFFNFFITISDFVSMVCHYYLVGTVAVGFCIHRLTVYILYYLVVHWTLKKSSTVVCNIMWHSKYVSFCPCEFTFHHGRFLCMLFLQHSSHQTSFKLSACSVQWRGECAAYSLTCIPKKCNLLHYLHISSYVWYQDLILRFAVIVESEVCQGGSVMFLPLRVILQASHIWSWHLHT